MWLTVQDVVEKLPVRVHPETIRRAIRRGELPARKFGRVLLIKEEDFKVWIRKKLEIKPFLKEGENQN